MAVHVLLNFSTLDMMQDVQGANQQSVDASMGAARSTNLISEQLVMTPNEHVSRPPCMHPVNLI